MSRFWGAVTEVADAGVVAEHCPFCEQLMPCLLRFVSRGDYLVFIKVGGALRECSCLCTGCLKAFPGQPHWHYAAVLPIAEAKSLSSTELLAKTNPVLGDRLQFKEQICALGCDGRFAAAYEQLEAMRPGPRRAELLRQLLDWDRLEEKEHAGLAGLIASRARASTFARRLAASFPESAGCLTLGAAALLLAAVIALVPWLRSWVWGTAAFVVGLIVATVVNHTLTTRRIRQWTRRVLIPEAADAHVPLEDFLEVIDDVPGSRLGLSDELWPIKDALETIRLEASSQTGGDT